MQKFIDVSGKSESDALEKALRQLNLMRDEVSVELVERAKAGFLGIGASPAVMRIYYQEDESVNKGAPESPAPKQAAQKAQKSPSEAPKPPKAERTTAKAPAKKETSAKRDSPVSAAAGEHAKMAREFLEGLLEHMGISAEIALSERDEKSLLIEISGENMGAVIGRRGETLDAIQHLTNYTVNRGAEERTRISVDAENYRSKREDALVRLAYKMADKTLKYKRSMALEPMNSYERHIIHTALQDYEGVTTGSTGSEPNRRVVISCEKTDTANK